MKNVFIFCGLFIFSAIEIFAQNPEVKIVYYDSTACFLYSGQNIWEEKAFAKDGKRIKFFEEDSTKIEQLFEVSKGQLTGHYFAYFLNGNLAEKGTLREGKASGHWFTFSDKKPDFRSVTTYGDQLFESEYYNNEKLWSQYYRGQRPKILYSFYDSGQIKSIVKYGKEERKLPDSIRLFAGFQALNEKAGEDSIATFFAPNGQISRQGKQSGDAKTGHWDF